MHWHLNIPPPPPKYERTCHSNRKARYTARKSVYSRVKLQSRAIVLNLPPSEASEKSGGVGVGAGHRVLGPQDRRDLPPHLQAGGNQAEVLFLPSLSTFPIYQASGFLTVLRMTREKSISSSADFPCPHAGV